MAVKAFSFAEEKSGGKELPDQSEMSQFGQASNASFRLYSPIGMMDAAAFAVPGTRLALTQRLLGLRQI
ncbi:MAG TPA: hypothetical protein VNY06_06355 [Methylocella sp.]|nr:hypothetical protein [Methylocella sp.]